MNTEDKTGLDKLLESLVNQSNGCGQGNERYILSGIIDYTKKLIDEEKLSKDKEIESLKVEVSRLREALESFPGFNINSHNPEKMVEWVMKIDNLLLSLNLK